MDWIIEQEVKEAAKQSLRAAIECSIKHWQQLATASVEEIKDGCRLGKVSIHGDFCAFCKRFGIGCVSCPLKEKGVCCCKEWREARDLFLPTESNISAFRNAAHKLIARLYKELADCPEEVVEKQVSKPKIRHGDYGMSPGYPFILFPAEDGIVEYWQLGCGEVRRIPPDPDFTLEGRQISGNIFDLIKAKQEEGEDLTKFEVSDESGTLAFCATKQTDFDTIWLEIHPKSNGFFNLEQATTIHQKLGQIIATSKRKDC